MPSKKKPPPPPLSQHHQSESFRPRHGTPTSIVHIPCLEASVATPTDDQYHPPSSAVTDLYVLRIYIYILNEVTYTQSCSRAVEVLYHTQLGKMSFDGILDFIDEVSLYFLKRVPVSSTSAQDGDALEGGVRL